MATAIFYSFSKRKNSTKVPTGSGDSYDVSLKSGTSLLSPTLLLNIATRPSYNYLSFEGRYYFVDDIVSVRQDLWEIACTVDVLATYKADILASTQYVCYSASTTGNATWLADTRIPLLKETEVDSETESIATLFNSTGFYVLSVVGTAGCETFAVDKSDLQSLIVNLQSWQNTGIYSVLNDDLNVGYDFSTVETALESVAKMSTQTGFIGNSYSQAPACIRSCIWVPFELSSFTTDAAKNIFLGVWDTGVQGIPIHSEPATGFKTINIPWFHTDWRRSVCEDVYLYLPLVGMVKLSADSITNASSIIVNYSATATDGCVAYELVCGGEIIGTYGGQCSSNYPIGINQQASAGEIAQSIMAGADKIVSTAVHSSLSPVSAAGVVGAVAVETATAAYNTVNVANTTHMSCVGGIGGGSGAGLPLFIECYVVNHETIVTPSAMASTMGRPVMKPVSLSGLTGYCQCANAHVSASATGPELQAIDSSINSGFYIE